jgi:hypothetical protein
MSSSPFAEQSGLKTGLEGEDAVTRAKILKVAENPEN